LCQPDICGAGASKAQFINEYLGVSLDLHGAALEEEQDGSTIATCLEIIANLEFNSGNSLYPGDRTLFLHQHLTTKG
jgi:hypothetical protein